MQKEMKKKTKNTKNNKKDNNVNTINALNIIFVDIQIVVTILTVILAIVFLFNRGYFKLFQLSLGINLLVMAFNNYKIYERSKLTFIYAMAGIIILLFLGV